MLPIRNRPCAARRLPGRSTKQNCVSPVPAVCARFLSKPRERRRRSPSSRSRKIGRMFRRCCGWSARTSAVNISRFRMMLLSWIVAGLNYLVDPFDLIPDKTPFLGFVDDATVVEFVADKSPSSARRFHDMGNGAAIRLAARRLRPRAAPDFPGDAVVLSSIPHREHRRLRGGRNSS